MSFLFPMPDDIAREEQEMYEIEANALEALRLNHRRYSEVKCSVEKWYEETYSPETFVVRSENNAQRLVSMIVDWLHSTPPVSDHPGGISLEDRAKYLLAGSRVMEEALNMDREDEDDWT